MTQEERHQLVADLAALIGGLQVSYSVNRATLGTAGDAWVRVWNQLGLCGWQDVESIRIKLATALLDE